MIKLHTRVWYWYGLAVALIVIDQLTKYWISNGLEMHTPQVFTSFFNFTLMHNYGAAFSFLSDAGGWQRYLLGGLAIAVSIGLIVWIARLPKDKIWEPIALAMVLGGAVGNLYDRITLGYVVDFIVVHYKEYYWPAFNVADMAISCGAFMLVVEAFRGKKTLPQNSPESMDKQ